MPTLERQQLRLIAILLAATIGVLAIAWFAFLHKTYLPAYQNLRQADASAIVAELGKAGIAYRLDNDGHDVLVPEEQVSEARVAVAGSNIAMGGTVGFELFNDSDMGLTEFAQKINFQRAMQGELARTIMMSEGVEFARVHLALPERSIFRSGQGEPTAAVTVQMIPGQRLDENRIAGIRQLIASSVPGLMPGAVAVLDHKGDLMTATGPADDNAFGAPLDERAALDRFYRARVADAITPLMGTSQFEVTVNTRRIAAMPTAPASDAVGPATPTTATPESDRAMPEREAVALMIEVRTAAPLAEDLRARIETAVADRLELRRERGDSLRFITGAMWQADQRAPARASAAPAAQAAPRSTAFLSDWTWLWLALGAIAAIVAAWLALRPRRQLDEAEIATFAEHLRAASLGTGGGLAR